MTLREIHKKDVIQIDTGACLGRIDDLFFDRDTSEVESFLMLGRPKWFGLFGKREESLTIPWHDVVCFGVDVILVRTCVPERPAHPEPPGGPKRGDRR